MQLVVQQTMAAAAATSKPPPPRYKLSELARVCELGKGILSKVYLYKHTSSGELVAVKEVEKSKVLSKGLLPRVMAERDTLRKLAARDEPCPHVPSFLGNTQDKDKLYFFLEPLLAGGLHLHIAESGGGGLPEATARFYAQEVGLGLHALHEMGIGHRDLKASNVVLRWVARGGWRDGRRDGRREGGREGGRERGKGRSDPPHWRRRGGAQRRGERLFPFLLIFPLGSATRCDAVMRDSPVVPWFPGSAVLCTPSPHSSRTGIVEFPAMRCDAMRCDDARFACRYLVPELCRTLCAPFPHSSPTHPLTEHQDTHACATLIPRGTFRKVKKRRHA